LISGDLGSDTIEFEQTTIAAVSDIQFQQVTGVETLKFDGGSAAVTITVGAKADAAGVTAVTIKEVDTGTHSIAIAGGSNANNVTYTGSNTATVDIVATGGSGNDTFNTGTAANDSTFAGGAGTNTFNVKNLGTGHSTIISDLKGSDVLTVGAGATAVAAAVTADFTATATTTNSSDSNADVVLTAAAGKDISMAGATVATGFTLNGSTGAEILIGSTQADIVAGAAANDTIDGGTGADVITGGSGVDSLTGGTGVDAFRYSESKTTDIDSITDFAFGATGDNIGLTVGTGYTLAAAADTVLLSTLNGTDISAATNPASILTVTKNVAVTSAATHNVIKLATAATNFSAAIGTIAVTVTGMLTNEGVGAIFHDSTASTAVFGIVLGSATGATVIDDDSVFLELGRMSNTTVTEFAALDAANFDFF
jgi:Ca2+-binding RTX toxin-like protein